MCVNKRVSASVKLTLRISAAPCPLVQELHNLSWDGLGAFPDTTATFKRQERVQPLRCEAAALVSSTGETGETGVACAATATTATTCTYGIFSCTSEELLLTATVCLDPAQILLPGNNRTSVSAFGGVACATFEGMWRVLTQHLLLRVFGRGTTRQRPLATGCAQTGDTFIKQDDMNQHATDMRGHTHEHTHLQYTCHTLRQQTNGFFYILCLRQP